MNQSSASLLEQKEVHVALEGVKNSNPALIPLLKILTHALQNQLRAIERLTQIENFIRVMDRDNQYRLTQMERSIGNMTESMARPEAAMTELTRRSTMLEQSMSQFSAQLEQTRLELTGLPRHLCDVLHGDWQQGQDTYGDRAHGTLPLAHRSTYRSGPYYNQPGKESSGLQDANTWQSDGTMESWSGSWDNTQPWWNSSGDTQLQSWS